MVRSMDMKKKIRSSEVAAMHLSVLYRREFNGDPPPAELQQQSTRSQLERTNSAAVGVRTRSTKVNNISDFDDDNNIKPH